MSSASGIRATVAFPAPAGCPIADISDRLETTVRSVTASIQPVDHSPTVVEFVTDGAVTPPPDAGTVFSIGTFRVWRITHRDDRPCPCTTLGESGIPIARYRATRGDLRLVFYTQHFEELRTVMDRLQGRHPDLDVRRLLRSPRDHRREEYVMFDVGTLTERQLQMLEAAYRRGYFDHPRGVNATEIAAEFGIDPSTFREHINRGLSKLLENVVLDV